MTLRPKWDLFLIFFRALNTAVYFLAICRGRWWQQNTDVEMTSTHQFESGIHTCTSKTNEYGTRQVRLWSSLGNPERSVLYLQQGNFLKFLKTIMSRCADTSACPTACFSTLNFVVTYDDVWADGFRSAIPRGCCLAPVHRVTPVSDIGRYDIRPPTQPSAQSKTPATHNILSKLRFTPHNNSASTRWSKRDQSSKLAPSQRS